MTTRTARVCLRATALMLLSMRQSIGKGLMGLAHDGIVSIGLVCAGCDGNRGDRVHLSMHRSRRNVLPATMVILDIGMRLCTGVAERDKKDAADQN
jgi:hypothetical protein